MYNDIENLIKTLGRMPGLGPRSARRSVLYMLKKPDSYMIPLINSLQRTLENTKSCSLCSNYDTIDPCSICVDEKRNNNIICVVEDVSDLWAFEKDKIFQGKYHVLGGSLSALEGIKPSDLNIESLVNRIIEDDTIQEIIIATNATVDGQTTAFYINERISEVSNIKITRLAYGIPVGGELDYLDEGTLSASLNARKSL